MLPKFGIVGAAWAYLISVLPIIFMFYYVEKIFLELSDRFVYYLKLFLKIALVSGLSAFLCKWAILPLVKGVGSIIFFGPFSVLLFLLVYGLFGFYDEEDIKAIRDFVVISVKKIKFAR
mgnify:CR=1 FL=1